jgi:hypothetical protein
MRAIAGLVLAAAAVGAYFRGEFARGRELSAEAVRGGVVGSLYPSKVLDAGLIFVEPDELPAQIARVARMKDDAHPDPIGYVGFHGAAANMAAELGHTALAQDHARRAVEMGRHSTHRWHLSLALYAFGRAWWQTKPEAALEALPSAPAPRNRGSARSFCRSGSRSRSSEEAARAGTRALLTSTSNP